MSEEGVEAKDIELVQQQANVSRSRVRSSCYFMGQILVIVGVVSGDQGFEE